MAGVSEDGWEMYMRAVSELKRRAMRGSIGLAGDWEGEEQSPQRRADQTGIIYI